jgi:predicted nucleic acid-binding protein
MLGPDSLRPHFLDASALVKLVAPEPGSDGFRKYFQTNSWFVTSPLCIAEALGVLKRHWQRDTLTDERYYAGAWELLFSYRDGGRIQLAPEHLGQPEAFVSARQLSATYALDLSDALQLHLLLHGSLASYCEGSQAVLVSADRALTNAARAEGLLAWDILTEASPP